MPLQPHIFFTFCVFCLHKFLQYYYAHTACDSMQSFINFFIHFFYYLFAFFIGLFMYCHQPVNQAPLFIVHILHISFVSLCEYLYLGDLCHVFSTSHRSSMFQGVGQALRENYRKIIYFKTKGGGFLGFQYFRANICLKKLWIVFFNIF